MIENIFEKIKNFNFYLGIKFENINFIRFNSHIKLECYKELFYRQEILEIEKFLQKGIEIIKTDKFNLLPFPVRNSKFFNFVLMYNGINIIFFQKNNLHFYEKYEINSDPIDLAKKIAIKKLPFLKENYKYMQLVFPWSDIETMKKYYLIWNKFRDKKFIGDIHFSYFLEVGYEPSSSPSSFS